MKVRLTRKHAESIDGIDLSGREVGDLLDLTADEARLLVAEEWAVSERRYHSDPTAEQRRSDDRPRAARKRTLRAAIRDE